MKERYPAKYSTLLDDEVWSFIGLSSDFYPSAGRILSLEEQRRYYDRLCAHFSCPYPDGIETHDDVISHDGCDVPIRSYGYCGFDDRAVILYFHGGGFVVGGLGSHDSICAELCFGSGFRVISVAYRLSPEHVHPAAFEDCYSVYRWCVSHFGCPIIVCGDSAGGTLAACVSHRARERNGGDGVLPLGQLLIYPCLGGDMSSGSYIDHGDAPLLTLRDVEYYMSVRGDLNFFSHDSTFAPLYDRDFSGLPQTLIIAAECDPLCDDAYRYRDKILSCGGSVEVVIEKGLVHGYLRARDMSRLAGASFARIVGGLHQFASHL